MIENKTIQPSNECKTKDTSETNHTPVFLDTNKNLIKNLIL